MDPHTAVALAIIISIALVCWAVLAMFAILKPRHQHNPQDQAHPAYWGERNEVNQPIDD